MPSIQTSLLIAIPAGVGQTLPGLCSVSVRQYIAIEPSGEPGKRRTGFGIRDKRREQRGPRRDLTRSKQTEEGFGRNALQDREGPGRHSLNGLARASSPFHLSSPA